MFDENGFEVGVVNRPNNRGNYYGRLELDDAMGVVSRQGFEQALDMMKQERDRLARQKGTTRLGVPVTPEVAADLDALDQADADRAEDRRTFTVDGDEYVAFIRREPEAFEGEEWSATVYGDDDAPGDPSTVTYGPTPDEAVEQAKFQLDDSWKRDAIAADVAGFAAATGMTEVVAPDGTAVDPAADLDRILDNATGDGESMPEISVEDANAEVAAMVADRAARDAEENGEPAPVAAPVVETAPDGTLLTDGFTRRFGNVRNKPGTVRTTNGGEVHGLISSEGGTYPLEVWNEDGTFNVGLPGWRVAGVKFDPEPAVPEAALVDATTEGAPPAVADALDPDGVPVQPEADASLNLDAIRGDRFTPPSNENMTPAGKMAKLDANLAALRTLRRLQREGRAATPEEQTTLSQWAGWGGIPEVFDVSKPAFASRRDELLTLLSTAEWNEARRNTLNAHYTDPRVVSSVWAAMRDLGFDGGRVLEPGSGSGTFIGLAPDGTDMVGVELDSTTAALSKYLYPDAQIRNESFADTTVPDGAFDATVGNVPFGNFALVDRDHNPDNHNIHNHFILKSLALTRPGGLVSVLSSRYTLDGDGAKNRAAREKMYEQADLIGAVRLPNGSHDRASGTDVIEDILIFRKRLPGEEPGDRTWVKSTPRNLGADKPLPVSDYFAAHPENVLGTLGSRSGQFGPEVAVTGDRDFPDLAVTLDRITAAARERGQVAAPRDPDTALPDLIGAGSGRYEGNIAVDEEGNFTQAANGAAVAYDVPVAQRPELRALIGLRDTLRDLLAAEAASGEDTEQITALRASLNTQYDDYLATYGPINRYKFSSNGARNRPRQGRFRSDPLSASVRALETYDPTGDGTWPGGYKGSVGKASIFTERAVAPRTIATTAENPADALTLSMDTYAEVNLPAIAKMLGTDEQDARRRLGDLVFEVPPLDASQEDAAAQVFAAADDDPDLTELGITDDTFPGTPGRLVPAAEYLSGNVRQKIAHARIAAAADPRYRANVDALKAVIPDDLGPAEIDGRLGAPWVPASVVEDFVRETLRIPSWESAKSKQARVRTSGGGIWTVEAPRDSSIAREEYGIDARGGTFPEIVQALLEQRSIKITKPDPDDPEKRIADIDATIAAQAKAEMVQERFGEWLWENPDRARKLQKGYNNQFNAIALRTYDGSGRSLIGASEDWQRKVLPHVKNAVERIVNEPTALLAHVVGAGKTAEMVMGSAELRRLGLARKPAIVVPNHMLEQFTREYLEIYPNAKLLAAGSKDLAGEGRREFVARAAVGDWDAVILTQGAFQAIPMSKDQIQAYIDRETATMREQLEAAKAAGAGDSASKRTVKKMENALIQFENRLKKKLTKQKDAGVSFEQTGIDYLMVDEAHMYSNLMTNSVIQGAGVEGSDKATDLHMKMEYLRATTKSGRVATFASGTPFRNTVTQAYTMQRFLRPDLLREAGVHSFDQWAAAFGEIVEEMELKPEGTGFRQTARFAKFRNVPELLRMFHTYADVKLAEDLNLKTPNLVGGQAQTVAVPRTDQLAAYIRNLGDRAEAVRNGDVAPEEDNMLKISTDGRKAALSMALVKVGEDANGNPIMGKHEPGKIEEAAARIGAIYEKNKDRVYTDPKSGVADENPGSLQIVFLDMGTPKGARMTAAEREEAGETGASVNDTEADWNGYAALKAELVEKHGVPADQVRFIHEAKNDAEKAEMFAAAKNGRISVLVGSSEKMGVGTNMQRRALALHHLDAPWRPADVEQRAGRIYRQGNLNPDVQIFRYVTEGSFDAYMWQTLERKAKFINQIMKGTLDVREIEDIGDTAMSYAEVKALATGNPDLLDKAKTDTRLAKLQRMQRNHARAQTNLQSEVARLTRVREQNAEEAAALQAAIERRRFVRGEPHDVTVDGVDYTIGGAKTQRAEAGRAFNAALLAMRSSQYWSYRDGPERAVGTIGGFTIMAQEMSGPRDDRMVKVWLDGHPSKARTYAPSSLEDGAAAGYFTLAENAIDGLEGQAERVISSDAEARDDLERIQERIGLPFTQEAELEALRAKAERLTAKMARDEERQNGREIEYDPRIDSDEFDSPLVRGSAVPVAEVVPEAPPARQEVPASSLAVGARIEFLLREMSGETAEGQIVSARTAGNFVFVTIRTDDGQEYTRAFSPPDAPVIQVPASTGVKTLTVRNGRVVVEVKRANRFREHQHPRDSQGRFVETGAEVRLFGGALGRIVSMAGNGRVKVERSDGATVVVDSGNVTVTKKPTGEAVAVDTPPGKPGAAWNDQSFTPDPARGRPVFASRPAPDATPEGAAAIFRGPDGQIAWVDMSAGYEKVYVQAKPGDPQSIAEFDDAEEWASWVDRGGFIFEPENGSPLAALGAVEEPARFTDPNQPAAPTPQEAAGVDRLTPRRVAPEDIEAAREAAGTPPRRQRPPSGDAEEYVTGRPAGPRPTGGPPVPQAPEDIEDDREAAGTPPAPQRPPSGDAEEYTGVPSTPLMDAAIAAIGETGGPDATGTVDDPIDVQGDLDLAARLLAEDKHIRLNKVDEVGTLLDKLADNAQKMEAAGDKAPALDLCKVSVPGTNLFCQQSKGVPRAEMPQLSGAPLAGSPADALERNKRGRVDITGPFIDRLTEAGIGIEEKSVPASSLKASQADLNGVAVAGMMQSMRAGSMKEAPIFVTRDNYVIDGHHRWAAKVGLDTEDGSVGEVEMPVRVIDMEIGEALDYANAFAQERGIARVSHGQAAVNTNVPGTGAKIGGGGQALADTLTETVVKKETHLAGEVTSRVAEYDAALASGDIERKVAAQLALTETLIEVNNAVDTGGEEPERAAALDALAGVNAIVDANVRRLFPRADAGGTPPDADAPVIDPGTVEEFRGNADVAHLVEGGSAAAFLVLGDDGQYRLTKERQALHDAILASILDGVEPSDDPRYNFFGGGPASGKGSISRIHPQLKDNAAYINADEIKAVIPEMGARVRRADPAAAGFTHEESSYLAKRIQAEGFRRKVNVTLDGTGDGSPKGVRKKIAAAKDAGYKIDAFYVTVPTEVAQERAKKRAEEGVGADRGRVVAPTVIANTHRSVSDIFPQVANEFDSAVLYDTNVPWGTPPNVIARKESGPFDLEIVAPGKWQEFLDKAAGVAGA